MSGEQNTETTTAAPVIQIGVSRVFGWVLGALSILNLVEDLNLARIVGFLQQWLDAYSALTRFISEVFFGWIAFGWVSLTQAEANVLIIASVIGAAFARAYARPQITSKIEAFALPAMYTAILVVLLVMLPALLLPGRAGLTGAGFGLGLILALAFLTKRRPGDRIPPATNVVQELVGVVGLAAILIAASYAFR